jgi:ribosomal-protein-alanine N-acetyltransferase
LIVDVRLAVPSDAAALSAIHAASFDEGWSPRDFETWLGRKEAFAVLAIREREAVAFGLTLVAGEDAELLTIAVSPAQRRVGLGQEIFRTLNAEAASRSLKRWILEVARNNLPALALYKSEGFVEIGVRTAYYRQKEGRADALVLSRPVGPASRQGAT